MPFKDYVELVPPLRLPYRGKVYELPYVGVNDTAVLDAAFTGDAAVSAESNEWIERILLGDVGDEMRTDGVPAVFVARCILTALANYQAGPQAAEMVWETGSDPAAVQRWVADREAQAGAEAAA